MWSRYKECGYSTKYKYYTHVWRVWLRYKKCDYSAKKYIGRV